MFAWWDYYIWYPETGSQRHTWSLHGCCASCYRESETTETQIEHSRQSFMQNIGGGARYGSSARASLLESACVMRELNSERMRYALCSSDKSCDR